MVKVGSLVKFANSANKNTPGWRHHRKVGLVVFRNSCWADVMFGSDKCRVYYKDLEVLV